MGGGSGFLHPTAAGAAAGAMAASAASSEHFEKLHEIFRGLLEDLRGVPEKLLGSAGIGEAQPEGGLGGQGRETPPSTLQPDPRSPLGPAETPPPPPQDPGSVWLLSFKSSWMGLGVLCRFFVYLFCAWCSTWSFPTHC